MASTSPDSLVFKTVVQRPPGSIVAPNGFPADPRPVGAPKPFLDAMDVRIKIFCDEQKCAIEPELDEDDPKSWSWISYSVTSGATPSEKPVSTIRLVPPPHPPHPNGFHDADEEPYIKVTRVATLPEARGKGLSKKLLVEAFEYLAGHPEEIGNGWRGMVLVHAQVSVEKMYSRMGFVTDDRLGTWEEENIEHVGMWKRLEVKN